nr:unnamed protein product [Callosobruchus analis]
MYVFKISKQVISKIIPEVCDVIITVLHEHVKSRNLNEPTDSISSCPKENGSGWTLQNNLMDYGISHCVGSVDSKHGSVDSDVVLRAPISTGSEFFNYKSTYSTILMAVVDADYCFTFADVGRQGRISDGGVIKNTSFYKKLQENLLHLPPAKALPNTNKSLPFIFLGDATFPLEEHILRPYKGSHQKVLLNVFLIIDYLEHEEWFKMRSVFFLLYLGRSKSSIHDGVSLIKRVMGKLCKAVGKNEARKRALHHFCLFKKVLVNLQKIINLPQGEQEWLNIAKQFNDVWNFPNCVGSVDGKHVVLQAPINTGGEFFNYKSTFSIVLMAVVDADYCFTFADVGCQGRISDGGVIKNTSFYKKLQGNELHLPSDNALPNTEKVLPYVFVADDAFPLEEHIMKPYPGSHQEDSIERIFNYRLSRARRVVENAFGILSVVFRVLRKPMLLEPHKAAKVVLACIYLHNYLRRSKSSRNIYTRQDTFDQEIDGKIIQGSWRQEREANPTSLLPIRNIPRKSAGVSKDNRKQFAEYFKTVGRVPWQELYL